LLVTDSVATSVTVDKTMGFCIVYEFACRKVGNIEARCSTFGPARVRTIIIRLADTSTLLARMLRGAGPLTAVILQIPEAFVNQHTSGNVLACEAVVGATNESARTVFIGVAVPIPNCAIGVFVAAMLTTPTAHWELMSNIQIHHHLFGHLTRQRVLKKC
jgi:hypothetical protein